MFLLSLCSLQGIFSEAGALAALGLTQGAQRVLSPKRCEVRAEALGASPQFPEGLLLVAGYHGMGTVDLQRVRQGALPSAQVTLTPSFALGPPTA